MCNFSILNRRAYFRLGKNWVEILKHSNYNTIKDISAFAPFVNLRVNTSLAVLGSKGKVNYLNSNTSLFCKVNTPSTNKITCV